MKTAICFAGLAAMLVSAACSGPAAGIDMNEQARLATAKALDLDAAVAVIEVTDVERGATSSSWDARFDGHSLSCSGNEKFQLPDCRVNSENASN